MSLISKNNNSLGIFKKYINILIKFSLIMDNRDIVLEKKIWKEYNGNKNSYLSTSKSVEHPSRPPQKKVIRAEMISTSIYLREDKIDETLIYMINNVKIKTGIEPTIGISTLIIYDYKTLKILYEDYELIKIEKPYIP